MGCQACGAQNPDGSTVCAACGEVLTSALPPPPPSATGAVPAPGAGVAAVAVDDGPLPSRTRVPVARVHPPPVQAPPPPRPVGEEAPVETPSAPVTTTPVTTAAVTATSAPAAVVPATPATVLTDVPPREPEVPAGLVDPHAMAAAVSRLSAGAVRSGRVALGILTAYLEADEPVEALVQGIYQSGAAVGALTDRRMLLVNEREWAPDVRSIPLDAALLVQGWQDDHSASLTFVVAGHSLVLSAITDRSLAQDLAHRLRAKVAAFGA
jgi:hypothetical protein